MNRRRNDTNIIVLQGTLTKDPTIKDLGDYKVCGFTVAVQHRASSADVAFIDVEAWNSLAEQCTKELQKGNKVRLFGKIKQERWEKEGTFHSRIKITLDAYSLIFGSEKKAS